MPQTPALFLDRDGIFNEIVVRDGKPTSPRGWNEIRHYPGLEGLRDVRALGYRLVMITNQPDLERGLIERTFIDSLHGYYEEKYGLDAVYTCPYSSETHPWKKPNPGMFLQAAEDLGIDLAASFHLGDTERDTLAAERCGCKSILWERDYNRGIPADFRVTRLEDVVKILAQALKSG